jgi:hypothetical protein
MDPKPSSAGMLLAPPHASACGVVHLPSARAFPPLDQPIVRPETRDEMVRGRLLQAMPALPLHADQHFSLDYILGAHVKPGYVGSTDLLTRAQDSSNFATDTCIRKRGEDPTSRERYLEELSFEVVNTQSMGDITERAEDLITRGVRRVVAIFVRENKIREWSPQESAWQDLDLDGSLHDPVLATPLPLRALLEAAAAADDVVARALLAKNNGVLVAAKTESRQEGVTEGRRDGLRDGLIEGRRDGLAEGIVAACDLLGIELTEERRAEVRARDAAGLQALLAQIRSARRWP